MACLLSYCRFAKLSIESVLVLVVAIVIGTSLQTDQLADVDWTDPTTIVCLVDGEENSDGDSFFIDFVVSVTQCTVAVATGTESSCDFRDIIPKYVLYNSLRLDC